MQLSVKVPVLVPV